MRKLLNFGLLLLGILAFAACQQELRIPPEIIFVKNSLDESKHATISLEDVFLAKTNREAITLSQRKQNPGASSQSRAHVLESKPSATTSQRKPQIRIPKDVYDFGFVDEGELVSHSFRLYNEGPGLWSIEEILPSCGCTNVKATAMEVEEGAYIDVSFNFETAGRPGSQQKMIEIFSNAGYHRLMIKGVVYPPKFSQSKDTSTTSKDSL